MADIEVTEESMEEKESAAFLKMAHKVLLAGIGAVAMAQEEMEEFVQRLVERGEIAEKDGRRILQDVMERRKKRAEAAEADMGSELDRQIERILDRMNVPSKTDIDALGAKITLLAHKVDQLHKEQSAR